MSLQEQRKKAKLSQSQLSAVSGVSAWTISAYESGQRDINGASLDTLCKLALALNCKVYDVISDNELRIKLKMTT